MAKAREHQQPLYMCFVDFSKAFDSPKHEQLWWTMLEMGFPPHLVNLLSSLYKNQKARVRIAGTVSEWFRIRKGVRQGCVLSPCLFNILAEMAMRKALEGYHGCILIGGRRISNLRYADDIVLLATSVEELQELVDRLVTAGKEYNLEINTSKTKVMAVDGNPAKILVEGKELEQVKRFQYLGSAITEDAKSMQDFKERLAIGTAVMTALKRIWQGHNIALATKIRLWKALVWPVATYGCEGWTVGKDMEKKTNAFGMKRLRRILRIP
jgi:hypothetical protein